MNVRGITQYTRHELTRGGVFSGIEYWKIWHSEQSPQRAPGIIKALERAPLFTVFSKTRVPPPSRYMETLRAPDPRWSLFEVSREIPENADARLWALHEEGLGVFSTEPERDDEYWLSQREDDSWDDSDAAAMAILKGAVLMKIPSFFGYGLFYLVDYDETAEEILKQARKIY